MKSILRVGVADYQLASCEQYVDVLDFDVRSVQQFLSKKKESHRTPVYDFERTLARGSRLPPIEQIEWC